MLLLETLHVFRQRAQSRLTWCGDIATRLRTLALGIPGHHLDEIHHKLCRAVGDDGQVLACPRGHLLGKLNVEVPFLS